MKKMFRRKHTVRVRQNLFEFLRRRSVPRLIAARKSEWSITFNVSSNFTVETFTNYIYEATGQDLSGPGSLIMLHPGQSLDLIVAPGVYITVDLQGSLRFLAVEGGACTLSGDDDSTFEIMHGVGYRDTGSDISNAGGIRVGTGTLGVSKLHLRVRSCVAQGSAGIYVVYGKMTVGGVATVLVQECVATQKAGGGVSIWEGELWMDGDDSLVEARDCSSGDAGGGFINFGGTLEMKGENSHLLASGCVAGTYAPNFGYGSGFAFSNAVRLEDRHLVPTLVMRAYGAHISAVACRAVGSAAIVFDFAHIFKRDDTNTITARDNTASAPSSSSDIFSTTSAILFYQTQSFELRGPKIRPNPGPAIVLRVSNNTCDGSPCGAEIGNSLAIVEL